MNEGNKRKKIRLGLLINSFDIPNWVYLMLERIKRSDYAEIRLVVLNETKKVKKNLLSRIISNWDYLLYIAYCRLEDKLVRRNPDAFETKDAKHLLSGIPTIKVKPRQTKYSDWIDDKDMKDIKKYEIDVFIRLGFRILRGKILNASKFGVWSYHHGDNYVNRGGPAGFWEVFENHPLTGSILQIVTEDLDSGLVLYRSYSATYKFSVKRNRNSCYWKSLSFLPRKLKELYELGEEKFFDKIKSENKHLPLYAGRIYKEPKNSEFITPLIKLIARYIKFKICDMFFFNQWFLMFDQASGISSEFWRFKKIIPPKDRFWADPYVIYKDNLYYIFIEETLYKSNKGHISLIVMDKEGKYSNPVKILERPYHLSHPFVFELNGDYYMIPETASNKTIEVYKCIEFPDKWEFYKNLMSNITAVDNTLFHYQGKWWLFANVRENEGASTCDELFLFYSDDPLIGDWKGHPQNPIVSDVRSARPAGRIFEHKGNIYRPSQNNSKSYGYGLKINEIVRLSETEYCEREINSVEPNWDKNIKAVHIFNHENMLTVIDGTLRRPRFF